MKERLCHSSPEIFNPVNAFRGQPPSGVQILLNDRDPCAGKGTRNPEFDHPVVVTAAKRGDQHRIRLRIDQLLERGGKSGRPLGIGFD